MANKAKEGNGCSPLLRARLNGRIPEIVSTYISRQIYESAFLLPEWGKGEEKYIYRCI